MLTLTPASWFSWDFRVTADGKEIALIDRDWFRERAAFSIGRESFTVRKTSILRSDFVLEHEGKVVAEATKPSAFHRRFEVASRGRRLTVEAASVWRREFRVLEGGNVVGTIKPATVFGRTANAELPMTLAREVQLFVVFLVLVLWKRQADAAS